MAVPPSDPEQLAAQARDMQLQLDEQVHPFPSLIMAPAIALVVQLSSSCQNRTNLFEWYLARRSVQGGSSPRAHRSTIDGSDVTSIFLSASFM